MNSAHEQCLQNSDSEQCTESNLSRVHSAPTLGPGCAHPTRALRPGRAHSPRWAPCSGRVAARTGVLARRVTTLLPSPPVTIQFLYRDLSPLPRALRAVSRTHNAVLRSHAAISQRCRSLYRDLKVAPAMIQFLYRDTHP